MIYQQSFSEIQSALLLWTPLQLIQQILRVKHEEDRMNNLHYKEFMTHFQCTPGKFAIENPQTQQIIQFSDDRECLKHCLSLQQIMITIKPTILSQLQSRLSSPKLSNQLLNIIISKRTNKADVPALFNKKLSIRTESTRKSENKQKLKSVKPSKTEIDAFDRKRSGTNESILSKINHDLSKMINEAHDSSTVRKNFSLKFHKMQKSNKDRVKKSKEKHFKKRLLKENISQIKLNQEVKINIEAKNMEIDENYGLSLLKKKFCKSSEKKKYITYKERSKNTKIKTEEGFAGDSSLVLQTKSIQKGTISPMTPKPRLIHDFSKDLVWKDYSMNDKKKSRNSESNNPSNRKKSRKKNSSSSNLKKGLVSPKPKDKMKIRSKC